MRAIATLVAGLFPVDRCAFEREGAGACADHLARRRIDLALRPNAIDGGIAFCPPRCYDPSNGL